MKLKINIYPKKEILDHETKIVMKSLQDLGFDKLINIRLGKQVILEIDENNKNKVFDYANEICKKLLVNTIIQDYKIIVDEDK